MRDKKMRITEIDYIKANRKSSRQEEIEFYSHPVKRCIMAHKSKKIYDRNRMKRINIKSGEIS